MYPEEEDFFSETSITENKITQDPENMSKEAKMGSSIDGTKIPSILTPPPYTNKQDYKGGTNDKTRDYHTRETSDSPSDPDSYARNLDEEHKNEEDDDYIDPPSKKKDKIDYQLHEEIRNRLLLNVFSLKVINLVMFDIDNHKEDILAVG